MWYRFFFLNIFLFFLKTDSTELFRAFELRASIRISQKKKSRNNSIIQQSIFFLLLLQCTCKSETMGGCKVTIPVSRGTRLSFQSDTCLRDRCLSALASVTSSSRPCFPIDTPRHIMVALYKPHDTVQPLSSSDKQAHPCRGRASSLRHLSNLFHRMTGDRLKRKKKAQCLEDLRGTSSNLARTISRIHQFLYFSRVSFW